MLTNEDRELIDRLKETCGKFESAYQNGLINDEEYQEVAKLLEEAADKIEAISSTHT